MIHKISTQLPAASSVGRFLCSIPGKLNALANRVSNYFNRSEVRLDLLPTDIRDYIVSMLDITDIIAIDPQCGAIFENAWSERIWRKIAFDVACSLPKWIRGLQVRDYTLDFIDRVREHAIDLTRRKVQFLRTLEEQRSYSDILQVLERNKLSSIEGCVQFQRVSLKKEFEDLFNHGYSMPRSLKQLLEEPLTIESKRVLGKWRKLRDIVSIWNAAASAISRWRDAPIIRQKDTLETVEKKLRGFSLWLDQHQNLIEELNLCHLYLIDVSPVTRMNNLRVLYLYKNLLTVLPPGIEDLNQLSVLDANRTPLSYRDLPRAIRDRPGLSISCEGKLDFPLSFFQVFPDQ